MTTTEFKPTSEQSEILKITDKNLIVSASAGSGKTTIMIDKITNYIISQKSHINEILVLTYTKAAAYEMKKKLIDKLQSSVQKHPFLEEELDLVHNSDISTFDSFCQKIVKKYFYILNIDPSFKMLDEKEQYYIQNNAIKNAIYKFQEMFPNEFENLIGNLAPKRNTELIEKLIFNIYNYTTSILNPNDFLKTSFQLYSKNNKIAENTINAHYNMSLKSFLKIFKKLKNKSAKLNIDTYVSYLSNLIVLIEQILRESSLSKRLALIQIPEALKHNKLDEIELSKLINLEKNKLKTSVFNKMIENFISPEAINESYTNCETLISNLFNLLSFFKKEYNDLKKKINVYDFNDVERLTIDLLENNDICTQIKNTYKYIFVDEFQDANAIQEKIIFMLQNNNLFFVGDTKQSIYAFRQSDPEIFFKIQKNFENDKKSESKTLNCNFRTNKNILNFANILFSKIMTKTTCGLNYKKESCFIPMAQYDDLEEEKCVSLNLILEENEKKEIEPTKIYNLIEESLQKKQNTKYNNECLFICNKITELLGKCIYDNKSKTIRPITYKDITILIAKRNEFSKKLTQYFIDLNIPYTYNSGNNLDDCYDIKVLFQLLKYSLNQNNDYALTCLLNSPLFNFSDQELASIKLNSIEEPFYYNCVKNYDKNDHIYEKIKNFNNTINTFIFNCKYKGIYYAFNKIIRDTNYLLTISYENDFTNRQENINQYINSFANSQYNFNLVEFVEYKENSNTKIKGTSDKPFSNSIQITTMHSSKGLEYPIVILPNLDQDFTKEPNPLCIKINKKLGVGIKNFNENERKCSNGIFYEACRIKNKETELSEKIRLLYVAMTRAKNQLILVGTSKNNFEKFKSDLDIIACNNYLSMIVNCLNNKTINKINNQNEFSHIMFKNNKFKISQIKIDSTPKIISKTEIFIQDNSKFESLSKFLNKNFNKQKNLIALKNAVSSFTHLENASLNQTPKQFTLSEHTFEKPAEIGTLYHKILENINFNECKTISDIEDYIEYNLNNNEKQILKNISFEQILKNISLIKNFITSNSVILKEQKFVMNIPYNEVVKSDITEKIIIQGIIDLLIINKEDIVLIDYKLSNKSNIDIKNTYKKQIELYAMAISKQFKLPIKKYILNLTQSILIEM